jgi:2-polyprenyl-6-methoxyphenol hydroxylase-like FAD-dependent oxidoreductase
MSITKEKIVTDILIIGAGPTGLMAANQLMRFGIESIIIDSKSGPTIESRAIAVKQEVWSSTSKWAWRKM